VEDTDSSQKRAVTRSKSEAGLNNRLRAKTTGATLNPKQIESPYRTISQLVPAPAPYVALPKADNRKRTLDDLVSPEDPQKLFVNVKKLEKEHLEKFLLDLIFTLWKKWLSKK